MSTYGLNVLVTGVNGYIGSHVAKALHTKGFSVDGIDNRDRGMNNPIKYLRHFKKFDITNYDSDFWYSIKHGGNYDTIVHLAGLISVEESTKYPELYFNTNSSATDNLIEYMKPNNFIYASTAGAFNPISPYAQSKLLSEEVIKKKAKNYTIFRFFNVAGNDGEFRQVGKSTHLIRIAAEAAAGKRDSMYLYGTDYDTPDGTCIRDYVDVRDLASAIVKAVFQPANTDYECLGTGKGYSCRDVINTMKRVTGKDFKVIETERRAGDPPVLMVDKKSKYIDCLRTLEDMCLSAYNMELK